MKKKLFGVFTAFIMIVGTLLPVFPVQAAPYIPKKIDTFYYPKINTDFNMGNEYFLPDKYPVLVKKCKSSDPSVAVVKITDDYGGQTSSDPYIEIKKPGTATLKIVINKNGEKKTYTVKLTVKKYKNPLKTFKIGKKDYTKKYNKTQVYGIKGRKTVKGKLKVTAAKGYKIKKITAMLVDHKNGYRYTKNVKFKNKDTIELKYSSELYIYVQNKKTKKIIEMRFRPGYSD